MSRITCITSIVGLLIGRGAITDAEGVEFLRVVDAGKKETDG